MSEPTWGFIPRWLFSDEGLAEHNEIAAMIQKANRDWFLANPLPPFQEFKIPKYTAGEESP